MGFVIASEKLGGGRYVARRGPFDFKCVDYLAPIYREYDGRMTARQALIFDSPAAAQAYKERNAHMIPAGFRVWEYDPCTNCMKGVVPCVVAGAGSVPVVGAG